MNGEPGGGRRSTSSGRCQKSSCTRYSEGRAAICSAVTTRSLSFACNSFSHGSRSEEHTSELQSQSNLVCRLLPVKNQHTPSNERSAGATAANHARGGSS